MRKRQYGVICLFLVLLLSGCKKKPDLGNAEEAVRSSLEAWKEGRTPQQLAEQGIEMADPNWTAGDKLREYELKTTSAQPQQGPRVVVVLHLQTRAGKKEKMEVAYEVLFKDEGKISIGRDAFHVGQ